MSKSFVCRRRPEATAVMMEVIDHCRGSVTRTEKKHGRDGLKTLQALLILAAMYHVLENYEKAEPLLKGHLSAAKRKSVPDSRETVWASTMLAEAYFKTNRIGDAMLITKEARALCGSVDPNRKDPLLSALLQLALSLGAGQDSESRMRGLAAALVALCWCVSHGIHRAPADAQSLESLRHIFGSYGIEHETWEWALKHANLTKYDFLGLLSVLLHGSGLLPSEIKPPKRERVRVIHLQ